MDPLHELALPALIHDLNNVFQALVEAADTLSGDPDWAPLSATIFRSIDRGKEITLSMQTADQPSEPFETVLYKARTLLEDSMLTRGGPNIKFEGRIQPDLVLRHAWAWERVLINLLRNAVEAMPQGGTIHVDARRKGSDIQIVVADEGPGIAPELLPSIFHPKVSTKPRGGLGLFIVHSIVKQETGEVRAGNRRGGGAEFTITFPAEPSASQGSEQGPEQGSGQSPGPDRTQSRRQGPGEGRRRSPGRSAGA